MKIARARTWASLLTVALLVVAVGCSSDKTSSGSASSGSGGGTTLKAVHLADLTGSAKTPNAAQIRGVDLAVDVLKEQGVNVTIDRRDTGADPARATSLMNEAANDSSIVWQLGPPTSGEFSAAVPIADQLKMPIQSISGGGVFTNFNDYTFRSSFSENSATGALIDYAKNKLHATQFASLYANDNDFARTSAEYFMDQAQQNGITFVTKQTFSANDINFDTQASEIASKNPQAVYIAANTNAGLLIKALRSAGYNGPILATNNTIFDPKGTFDSSGGNTNNVIFVAPFDPNDQRPVAQDFFKRFAAKYPGVTPSVQEALGYDAMMMLGTAAKNVKGSLTRDNLRQAMASVTYDGVTGDGMTFPDGKGDAKRATLHFLTIQAPGVAVTAP